MADSSTDLDSLFDKLDKFIRNSQHKKALKAAEDILRIQPSDEDAKKIKITAHVQLEEWEAALTDIGRNAALAQSMVFEKAYCQYKLGKVEEGLATLSPIVSGSNVPLDQSQPALELAAQMHYRQGRSQQCIQLYNTLLQKHKADSPELKTNVLAAYVAAGLSREIPALMTSMRITADQSFEVGYNKACGLVACGDWATAENELRRAIKRGRETLFDEEECTEEQVDEELAPLTVQLAYVLGRLGRHAEAQELYDSVLRSKSELADAPTRAVAISNSFADTGRIDSSAAHKKTVAGAAKKLEGLLQDASKPGALTFTSELEARLNLDQKRLLSLNRALTYLLAGRLDPVRQIATAIEKLEAAQQQGGSNNMSAPYLLPLLQAALLQKEGKVADADALLDKYAASNPSSALEPTLARVQLALEAGNSEAAAKLLGTASKALGSTPKGALVATQTTLLTQGQDVDAAIEVLTQTLTSLRSSGPSAQPAVSWCLETLVELQLRQGKLNDAVASYKSLTALGVQTATTAALLSRLLWALASSGNTSPDTWGALTKGLPNLTAATKGLNMDVLEGSVAAASKVPVPASQKQDMDSGADAMDIDGQATDADQEQAAKAHRKRRNKKRKRLPKGYNPELPNGGLAPPDPERWMPKWQRSDAKKKKQKTREGKAGVGKGSQGAGKVDESLDVSKSKGQASTSKPQLPAGRATKRAGKK